MSGNFENMGVGFGGNGSGSFEMINTIDQPTDLEFSAAGDLLKQLFIGFFFVFLCAFNWSKLFWTQFLFFFFLLLF